MEAAPPQTAPPQQRRFTVEEYYRMEEADVFTPKDRTELLDGHIYEMSPIGSEHAACVRRLTRLFVKHADPQALVSTQHPIRLSKASEPEPDISLLRPREDDYAARHPRPDDVLLVIEVADTSLTFHQDVKLPLYARTALPEVWIVALESDQVHVYREPADDHYAEHETYEPGDDVSVSALPSLDPVPVNQILGE